MKYKHQCECIDNNCRTVIVGSDNRLDGISCPRCGGPVRIKPFEKKKSIVSDRALFVRRMIIKYYYEHCFELTPEQVDTVLSLGDKYTESIGEKQIACNSQQHELTSIDEVKRIVQKEFKRLANNM